MEREIEARQPWQEKTITLEPRLIRRMFFQAVPVFENEAEGDSGSVLFISSRAEPISSPGRGWLSPAPLMNSSSTRRERVRAGAFKRAVETKEPLRDLAAQRRTSRSRPYNPARDGL